MRLILNIIWLVFGGLWLALGYFLAAIICFILIITIPFGIAAFRIAGYVLWPFGRSVVMRRDFGAGALIVGKSLALANGAPNDSSFFACWATRNPSTARSTTPKIMSLSLDMTLPVMIVTMP